VNDAVISPPWRPDRVIAFSRDLAPAQALASRIGVPCGQIIAHPFPDGETRVRVPLGREATALYCSLDRPNARLLELVLAASAARDQGVRDIMLIAPYLPYMRQDIAFAAGEAVSQKVVGALLAQHFDRLLTIDPHLHRTRTLAQIFDRKPAFALSATRAFARELAPLCDGKSCLVVGPDIESAPLAIGLADALGLPCAIAAKVRAGDRDVHISGLPDTLAGRGIIIIDDIVSSGATLATLAGHLRSRGAGTIDVCVTHALCDDSAINLINASGVRTFISCDSVAHPTNRVSAASVIADAFQGQDAPG
jgi:ribose-phosphate pyrophosphokinase